MLEHCYCYYNLNMLALFISRCMYMFDEFHFDCFFSLFTYIIQDFQ
jgi:hypothetical protein